MALVLGTCDEALGYAVNVIPQLEPFSAQQLSGGYCNFVYRIRCRKSALPTASTDSSPGTAHSVILKCFPPYIATNPSRQLSADRCGVELAALSSLQEAVQQLDPPASLVRIPRVVHADVQASVIVMEDAGEGLVSLLDALTQRHDPQAVDAASTHTDHDQLLPSSWPAMTATMLAQALHGFLAAVALHGSDPAFENPAAWAVLKGYFGNAAAVVQRFCNPQLSNWVARAPAFLPPYSSVTSLIFGDLWPNSVHFDPGSETIWVLDWELARRGTGQADAEQLLDNLWVMAQNPGKYRSETVQQLVQQLQLSFWGAADRDWRAGREAEFVRAAAMLATFPHWGLAEALPQVMQQAVQEAEELQGRHQAASQNS